MAKALQHAQPHQQIGRGDADGVIVGQEGDGEGRKPHHRDGDKKGALAAGAVAEPAEDDGAEGTHRETGRKGQEREKIALGLARRRRRNAWR